MIFTSGSTGRPKPVAVPHRALLNHALATRALFELAAGRTACCSSPAPASTSSPRRSSRRCSPAPGSSSRPSTIPRSPWRNSSATLRATGDQRRQPALRASGRQWATELLAAAAAAAASAAPGRDRQRAGRRPPAGAVAARGIGVPVANLYGVSEATVSTTALIAGARDPVGTVPIGRPSRTPRPSSLDAALRPVPGGVVGELFLGGAGVGAGLPRPARPHRRTVPAQPVRTAGKPPLPHRGSGPPAAVRRAGPDRARGRAGEDPRPPDRARRDRVPPGRAPGHHAGGGRRPPGRARRSRAWSRTWSCPARSARAVPSCAQFLRSQAAGEHAAGGVRAPGPASADRQRQAGPERAAGPRSRAGWRRPVPHRAPSTATEIGAGRDLGRSCWERPGRGRRRLLRAGRSLAAGHPGGVPGARAAVARACHCARSSTAPPSPRWPKQLDTSRDPARPQPPARPCSAARSAPPTGSPPTGSTASSTRPR